MLTLKKKTLLYTDLFPLTSSGFSEHRKLFYEKFSVRNLVNHF